MKTTMKTLSAALVAALSATAPAQAEDSTTAGLYVPYQLLAAQVRQDVAQDFDRRNAELGRQIRTETQATPATTADAREQLEPKNREGAFWM